MIDPTSLDLATAESLQAEASSGLPMPPYLVDPQEHHSTTILSRMKSRIAEDNILELVQGDSARFHTKEGCAVIHF